MTTLNKRLYTLGQKLTLLPRKAIKVGQWRVCPDKIVTWLYKDDKKEIYIMFGSCNMSYKLTTDEEYQEAKKELDNYNF